MAKFMFLKRSSDEGGDCEDQLEMTPEQMQAGMKAWMDWGQDWHRRGMVAGSG
jgi:hypothetical protein